MNHKVIVLSMALVLLLSGCVSGSGQIYINSPNGLSFALIYPGSSYLDSAPAGRTYLYALDVRPGYHYRFYLDSTVGDADLYVYYDDSLSYSSLLGYSQLSGSQTDTFTYYADYYGTLYIEVYSVNRSQYLLSVDAY